GVIWRAHKAARLETAAAARATIPRIGTTRDSQWIQTTPTAFSSTRSISGLQRALELSGMIPAVVIPARAHILFTWTSTLSLSCPDLRVFWQLGTMAASMELRTLTLHRTLSIRLGLIWTRI